MGFVRSKILVAQKRTPKFEFALYYLKLANCVRAIQLKEIRQTNTNYINCSVAKRQKSTTENAKQILTNCGVSRNTPEGCRERRKQQLTKM